MPDSVLHFRVCTWGAVSGRYPPVALQWLQILAGLVVGNEGLRRSIFGAFIPNERGARRHCAINTINDKLPSIGNVKTIVVDRSLAQLNAFQAVHPEARFSAVFLY